MYNVGDKIPNSSLTVTYNYRNGHKYICRCNICGCEDVYTSDELTSFKAYMCKSCEKISLKDEVSSSRIKILRKREIEGHKRAGSEFLIDRCFSRPLQKGDKFGELIIDKFVANVTKDYGSTNYGISDAVKVLLKCPICNKYEIIEDFDELYSKEHVCSVCSRIRKEAQQNVSDFRKKLDRHNEKLKISAAEKKKDSGFMKVKNLLDNDKHSEKIDKNVELITTLNNNLVVYEVIKTKSGYDTICTCKVCGEQLTISGKATRDKVICPGCEKKRQNPNYTGIYNRNYVGCRFNNLIIIEQYGDLCTVQCTDKRCGKKQENIRLYDILNRKIYCDCDFYSIDTLSCPHCNYIIEHKLKDIMKLDDNEIICPKCNKPTGLYVDNYKNEIVLEDKMASSRNKLEIAGKEFKAKVMIPSNSDLIYEKEPLYVGTLNNKEYYRCRCTMHNLDFVLTMDEIKNFDHEQCFDCRSHLIPRLDSNGLKL